MENIVTIFIFVIIGIFVLGFILPDANKSRTKSAKDDVKREFPGFLVLFLAATVLVAIFSMLSQ